MSTLTGTRSPTRDGSEGTPTFMVPSNPEGQAGLGFCAHFHDEKTALEKLGGCSLGGGAHPPSTPPWCREQSSPRQAGAWAPGTSRCTTAVSHGSPLCRGR